MPSLHMTQPVPVEGAARRAAAFNGSQWVLTPLIADQPVYRADRWIDARFQYPRPRTPLCITGLLPLAPTAVMIHTVDGSVHPLYSKCTTDAGTSLVTKCRTWADE